MEVTTVVVIIDGTQLKEKYPPMRTPSLRACGTQACAGGVSIIVVGGGAGLGLCR